MTIAIQPMKEQDISLLPSMEQGDPGAWGEEHFRSSFSQTGVWARVAVNGSVRGFSLSRKVAQELQIDRIAVAAECRKRGMGKMLMNDLLTFGRQNGCREAILEVRASNEAALRLYRGFDFQILFRRKAYYDNGEDAVVMRKDIQC